MKLGYVKKEAESFAAIKERINQFIDDLSEEEKSSNEENISSIKNSLKQTDLSLKEFTFLGIDWDTKIEVINDAIKNKDISSLDKLVKALADFCNK